MVDLSNKKRMVSEILGVGKSRVRLDPEASEHLQDAITRESIRGWLSAGFIWVEPKKGNSRGRVRFRQIKKKRRGLGQGSKKGAKGSRVGKKSLWVAQVRMLRHILKVKRDRGDISKQDFKKLYLQVKGAQIRTRKRLDEELAKVTRR
ncbi:MAG: 50S ribosomal protein L19e [Nitrososphaerota archaeon]|nr:50S ribosomal protein L19e [Nitrososphaerota archaeon]MDG6922544.1 50S ribosomal protein L19e [Nitrososphaerota archaeon]